MDKLPHMFCARCGGVLTDLHNKMVIDGFFFHLHCGSKTFEEKLDKDIAKLDRLIAEKRSKK